MNLIKNKKPTFISRICTKKTLHQRLILHENLNTIRNLFMVRHFLILLRKHFLSKTIYFLTKL